MVDSRNLLLVAPMLACVALGCSGSDEAAVSSPIPQISQDASVDTSDEGKAESSTPDADALPSKDASAEDSAASDATVEDSTPQDATADPLVEPDAQNPYTMPDRQICQDSYQGHTTTALTGGDELVEVSGIVASLLDDNLLWMHNDSGDTARLFAATTQGVVLGHVLVDAGTAVDWEDIAAGPCPDGTGPCLWIADTGNNTVVRDVLTVYVIREPVVGLQPFADKTVPADWTLNFKYPDTPVDAEAMVVSPDGSALWLFEKVDAATARLFSYPAPFDPATTVTLLDHGKFASPGVPVSKGRMITAADLHPSGERLLLRVYTGIYEYRFEVGQGLADIALVVPSQVVFGPLDEPQGEAVAYDSTGGGFWSISEANGGSVQPLHHYACNGTPVPP